MSVVLITGCSTGIGQEAAVTLAASGHRVYASCRRPEAADELHARIAESGQDIPVLALDLLNPESIDAAVSHIVEQEGRLDVLVNNAAIGGGRSLEETSLEEIREIYETNVFGSLTVLKAVIPVMRKQGSGRIICVTSLAGSNPFGCHGTYSSSKAALETFCMSLTQELAEHGVHVSVIAPGCVMTPMWTKGSLPAEDSPYANSFGRFAKWCEFGLARAAMPTDCAEAIRDAAESEAPQFRYPIGPDAEDFWRAYRQVNDDEEWLRIARLDNAAYAEKMKELMGIDYYA